MRKVIFPAFFHIFGFFCVFLFNFRDVGSVVEASGSVVEASRSVVESSGSVVEASGSDVETSGSVVEASGSVVESSGGYSPEQIGQILASMLLELEKPSNQHLDHLGNYK